MKRIFSFFLIGLTITLGLRASSEPVAQENKKELEPKPDKKPDIAETKRGYVVELEGPIGKPSLFILRRALKSAIRDDVPFIILSIDTPGGDLEDTLEIMEMLQRFDGEVIAFVKNEAISAGSLIAAACQAIYMAPRSVIGAAAPVQGETGKDIPKTLHMKLMSFMRAKIRSLDSRGPYFENVLRAMIDEAYVFDIDGQLLKESGELLSLTAQEAVALYGDPPESLLARGIAQSPQDAMKQYLEGSDSFRLEPFQTAWAEDWAHLINAAAPVLMGIAMLLVFIELQTPTFGLLGLLGVALFGVVFTGEYVAGFAGYEELFLLILGIVLVAVELFIFPGTLIAGLLGGLLVLGSLVWMMADIWPSGAGTPPTPFDWSVFQAPLVDVALSLLIASAGAVLLVRFLPRRWVWDRIVLKAQIQGTSSPDNTSPRPDRPSLPPMGSLAKACTDLVPSGEIEYQGKRYEALSRSGFITQGSFVNVVEHRDFSLLVELKDTQTKK